MQGDDVKMGFQKRLIGVREAATYLGIQRSTLYTWAERGKITSVKIGARLLFDLQDLDQFIEASKRYSKPNSA